MSHERFARLRLLLGEDGLAALNNSTVMVLGLGGVGSSCAEALARGGVGSLILIDEDVVVESNINRQALAFTSTLGKPKFDIMCAMVTQINPECRTLGAQAFIPRLGIEELLDKYPRPDYVIDCIDTVSQKLAIAHWCAERGIPLVASMGAANKLDPSFLRFADITETENCHLSRVIRRECRHRGIQNVEVLYTCELRPDLNRSGTTKSETLGSMSYMPPIMGQMLAGLTIRRLSGCERMPKLPRLVEPWKGKPRASKH